MNELDNLKSVLDQATKHNQNAIENAVVLNCEASIIESLNKRSELIDELTNLKDLEKIKPQVIANFSKNLDHYKSNLAYSDSINFTTQQGYSQEQRTPYKKIIEDNFKYNNGLNESLDFTINFFIKVGYFSHNVVGIGANGSGKTTLSNKFREYLSNVGIVLSAQRILLVPRFENLVNPAIALKELQTLQLSSRTNKNEGDINGLQSEFRVVLQNLLSDNNAESNNYTLQAKQLANEQKQIPPPKDTNLHKALGIWNSLIGHRTLSCKDGANITVDTHSGASYDLIAMSDGEKVLLYLIAQVLQAPQNGFIVVDEPEMYLHKTILTKLYDRLEAERLDCIFIYLTHDLDFAASRTTAKKIWIKSYDHPDNWEIELIPNNEIPQTLMFQLIGSRKNILFCEGEKLSLDAKIYALLFPNFTITPVGSCFNVINHTKAFNNIRNVNIEAFGLIDSDFHHPDSLNALKTKNIYHFGVAEVENLLFDKNFLKQLEVKIMAKEHAVRDLQDSIIDELDRLKMEQASNFVSAKISYYFQNSHVSKGNTIASVQVNFDNFIKEVNIQEWYSDRLAYLTEIINIRDYDQVITVFNNKGIKNKGNEKLNISDFSDRAIRLLQIEPSSQEHLYPYFPVEIVARGKTQD